VGLLVRREVFGTDMIGSPLIRISVDLARERGWDKRRERSAVMKSNLTILLFVATLLRPPSAVAQAASSGDISNDNINRAVDRNVPAMIELRHQVHISIPSFRTVNSRPRSLSRSDCVPSGLMFKRGLGTPGCSES
jgi:hypothetical protein